MAQTRVHVVIPTHTTRHLEATLAALAASENVPATVVVSVDGEGPGFEDLLARAPLAPATQRVLTARPHQGEARLNQVRNNGLRALNTLGRVAPADMVLVIDGDMALGREAIGVHARPGADLVLASRVNLIEQEAESLSRLLVGGAFDDAGTMMQSLWASARPEVIGRQRRLDRQRRLRALPVIGRVLCKSHKPKLLGGHHSVRWSALLLVNGYDERFVGYGFDDDDLARRLYASGARPAVRVDSIPAFHLWHATRAPARPTGAPGHATFATPWTVRAQSGIDDGIAQPEPVVRTVTAAASAVRSA